MRITLSKFGGFCDGVKRAYEMVMDLDISSFKNPIFVLGSLVHNPEVIKKIEEKGIQKIEREEFFSENCKKIGTLIITAHGDSPDVLDIAKKRKIDIFDVTCPKVIKVQKLAKVFFERGYEIILFGDKEHKEVRGIRDWGGGDAIVISNKEDIGKIDFSPYSKIAVLSQTTQNENLYLEIADMIKEKNKDKEIKIIDTTCNATRERQIEVKEIAANNEVVLVIGSTASANSVRLFEIAKGINPKTYFVENSNEIDNSWLRGVENVGITAGASTPFWVIQEVVSTLGKM